MSILEVLKALNYGEAVHELTQAVDDVTKAVICTGRAGSVTLKLNIGKASARQVNVTESITFSAPRPSKDATIYFADDEGKLSRSDPNQLALREELEAK